MAIRQFSVVALTASLFGLAACGSGDKTSAPVTPQQRPVVRPRVDAPADPTEKMAHAVIIGKSGAAVDLKYDVLAKPVAGKPIELDLALIPGTLLDSMTVSLNVAQGLSVVSTGEASFGKLAIGEVARHVFTLMAEHPGVVYLTVTANTYSVGISSTRAFAIPLIVADAAAEASTSGPLKTSTEATTAPAKE